MRRDNPIFFWLGILAAVISVMGLASTGIGIWFYLWDERERDIKWYADDAEWNKGILADMSVLKRELGRQTEDMKTIRYTLNDLRNDHHTSTRLMGNMAGKLEFHRGRHERNDPQHLTMPRLLE